MTKLDNLNRCFYQNVPPPIRKPQAGITQGRRPRAETELAVEKQVQQHIQDLKQAFICHSISTDKTLSVQQEQHEKLKMELERKERLINKFKNKMCDL